MSPRTRTERLTVPVHTGPARFGVVLPVHDEDQLLGTALEALGRAVARVSGGQVDVGVAVVLDACRDRSGELAQRWRGRCARRWPDLHVQILETEGGNVGDARRAGCRALLEEWSTTRAEDIWLATTDADSAVPADWISSQIEGRRGGAQVWVGGVSVRDWSGRSAETAAAWRRQNETELLPVFGANFGLDAATYLEAGGFPGLASGEDRALFERARALGAAIRHDPTVRVVTSGRRVARAPDGFAQALNAVEALVETSRSAARPELAAS